MDRLLLLSLLCVTLVSADGIGDRLLVNAFKHYTLPINVSDAQSQGWSAVTGTCSNNSGIEYANGGKPSSEYPISLFFTAGGQIAGMGVTVWKSPASGAEDAFWNTNSDGSSQIIVSFRDSPNIMCSGATESYTIGNTVVVDQGVNGFYIPLTASDAQSNSWTNGSCITSMGRHWSYDLETAPMMNWTVSTLFPIMPMYNEETHDISAVLLQIDNLQTVYPFGYWEGPFVPALMCLNWCDSSCTWNTDDFSTMHFFFTDPNLNTCASRC